MDFTLNEEQRALQDTAGRFAQAELKDIAMGSEQQDEPPGRNIVRQFAEMSFLGINLDG